MSKPAKHPRAYAWELEDGDGLCRWAASRWAASRDTMTAQDKPSTRATLRMVRLVPEGEYRKMLKAYREADRVVAGGKQ